MIRIGFCDDDLTELERLRVLLDRYRTERDREMECAAFRSPLDLLAAVERGARFHILFLDILMPGEDGIGAAEELRRYDSSVKIIFLTSSAEYAVDSYRVGAYFYQLKPIREESLFPLLDAALAACEEERAHSLVLRCRGGITRVEVKRLEYCEVLHRTLFLHLRSGAVLESTGSLDELHRQLQARGSFLRPHRSYLINLDCVQTLSPRSVIMLSGAEIPLPRGKYNEVKDAFLAHAFRERQAPL